VCDAFVSLSLRRVIEHPRKEKYMCAKEAEGEKEKRKENSLPSSLFLGALTQ
jgi:hypothetical protein